MREVCVNPTQKADLRANSFVADGAGVCIECPPVFEQPNWNVRTATRALTLTALLASAAALAQPVYKSTMPDGSVVYSEKPAPGAARVETIQPAPTSGLGGLTGEEKARAAQSERDRAAAAASTAQAERELDAARKELRQAEAAREAGKDPLPNERMGIVGGGSRLTEAYHARQKALEDAVDAARKRVSDAERALR